MTSVLSSLCPQREGCSHSSGARANVGLVVGK